MLVRGPQLLPTGARIGGHQPTSVLLGRQGSMTFVLHTGTSGSAMESLVEPQNTAGSSLGNDAGELVELLVSFLVFLMFGP